MLHVRTNKIDKGFFIKHYNDQISKVVKEKFTSKVNFRSSIHV